MNKLTFFSPEKTEGDGVTSVKYGKCSWEEKGNKLFSVSIVDRTSNELKLQRRRLRLDVKKKSSSKGNDTHRSI